MPTALPCLYWVLALGLSCMDKVNKKILIVEDDKPFLWILRQSFSSEGFEIAIAENGEEGLKMAEEEKPDLILLDILMPIMDGIETAKRIRAKGINVPVIFLTNMSDVEHISKAEETIPSDYIIKSDLSVDKIIALVKSKLGIA